MKYADYRPTPFDPSGLNLPTQQDWLVHPCSRNRDSDCLAESNFHVALRHLGGRSETVQVHHFNHWAVGWIDIILVHPSREKEVLRDSEKLAEYPCLDEEDYALRQDKAAEDYWESISLRDRIFQCQQARVSILQARHSYENLRSHLQEALSSSF